MYIYRHYQLEKSCNRLWSHLYPGIMVAIGRVVVYYTGVAHTFSTEIKCKL